MHDQIGLAHLSTGNPDTAPHLAATRVLKQFRVVFNAVKSHFLSMERQVGIGGAQVWALSVVRDRPGLGVNELARELSIRQPTASNLVRSLVDLGLVVQSRHPEDRRVVRLQITQEGETVLQRVPGPLAGVLPDALASLDATTLAQLEMHLGTLIRQLGVDESAATKPLADL